MHTRSVKWLVLAIGFVISLGVWTLMQNTPKLRAADSDRKISALERTIDNLEKRLEQLEDKLADREKVIAAASSGVTIKASRVTIDGGFEIDLDANTIKLNGGRQRVAHVGSKVEDGEVRDGARSVLVP